MNTPRFYAVLGSNDFTSPNAEHCNIDDAAYADLSAWLGTYLDPFLAAGVRNVLWLWAYGYAGVAYSAGTCCDGTTSAILPYNEANHRAIIGATFTAQIAPAFAGRLPKIDHLIVYGGPLHAASGTSNAELDLLTTTIEAIGATPGYDVQSALDFTLTPPHRPAVVRYNTRTGRKVYGEPWRGVGVNDAKAAGWDAYTSGYVIALDFADEHYADGTAQTLGQIEAAGCRPLIIADGSYTYAEQLAGLQTWMGRGCDFGCDMAARDAGERAALIAAANSIINARHSPRRPARVARHPRLE